MKAEREAADKSPLRFRLVAKAKIQYLCLSSILRIITPRAAENLLNIEFARISGEKAKPAYLSRDCLAVLDRRRLDFNRIVRLGNNFLSELVDVD